MDKTNDLVSFGNYLLSPERKKTIIHKQNLKCVCHADVENWKYIESQKQNPV